jgi:hypothetical protein
MYYEVFLIVTMIIICFLMISCNGYDRLFAYIYCRKESFIVDDDMMPNFCVDLRSGDPSLPNEL